MKRPLCDWHQQVGAAAAVGRTLSLVAAAAVLAGCAPHLIRANFDADAVGAPPSPRPPPPPEGQEILVLSSHGAPPSVLVVAGREGDNRLRLSTRFMNEQAHVIFLSPELTERNYRRGQPVYAAWQGFVREGDTAEILLTTTGTSGKVASLRVRNGILSADGRDLGRIAPATGAGGGHLLVWQLHPARGSMRIDVYPDPEARRSGIRRQSFDVPFVGGERLRDATRLGLAFITRFEIGAPRRAEFHLDTILVGQSRPRTGAPGLSPPPPAEPD